MYSAAIATAAIGELDNVQADHDCGADARKAGGLRAAWRFGPSAADTLLLRSGTPENPDPLILVADVDQSAPINHNVLGPQHQSALRHGAVPAIGLWRDELSDLPRQAPGVPRRAEPIWKKALQYMRNPGACAAGESGVRGA